MLAGCIDVLQMLAGRIDFMQTLAGRIDVMQTLAGRIDVNSPGLTTETELPINTQVDISTWQYIKIHYITSHYNMTLHWNTLHNITLQHDNWWQLSGKYESCQSQWWRLWSKQKWIQRWWRSRIMLINDHHSLLSTYLQSTTSSYPTFIRKMGHLR